MLRRAVCVLALVVVLALVFGSCTSAQILPPTPVPDEGVRGSGSIPVGLSLGLFDVNVWRSGNILYGGFKFSEVASNAARPANVIVSKEITSLAISGNFATVTAVGYWNGMLSDLTIEALDDLNMDWFHIVARPRSPLTIIYDKAGGVKGELVVYTNQTLPNAWAKGEGTIAVANTGNTGRFMFAAERFNGILKGNCYYQEYSMLLMPISRPPVRIYVPAWQTMVVTGRVAEMTGVGQLNGRPAKVWVKAVDNSMLMTPLPVQDEFYIRADSISATSIAQLHYEAGGRLKSGFVTVGSQSVDK